MNNKIILIFGIIALILIGVFIFAKPNTTANVVDDSAINPNLKTIKLKVNIPCQGHAGLIIAELKEVSGVQSARFISPNIFQVDYDSNQTTESQIISINIFKEYSAKIIN